MLFKLPPHGLPGSGQPHGDPYYRGVDTSTNIAPINETEFQEIMERNKTVSTSAIGRAVQDASTGSLALFLRRSFLISLSIDQVISLQQLKH